MNNHPEKPNNEDIDLGIFFNLTRYVVKKIKDVIYSVVILCKEHLFLVLSLIITGILLGLAHFFFSKPLYKTNMIATTTGVRNDYCEDLINKLNRIVEDDSPELLAQKLHISKESARLVVGITFKNLDQDRLPEDSVPFGLPFRINLSVYDKEIIDTMQNAIVNYLENNEYLLKRKKIRLNNIDIILQRINKEIEDIDSLKKLISSSVIQRNGGSGLIYGEAPDPVNAYREGFKLFEKKLDLITERDLIDNIQVVDGFLIRQKPDRPKLFFDILTGALSGFVIALIIANKKSKGLTT